jgi:hypothetical protein
MPGGVREPGASCARRTGAARLHARPTVNDGMCVMKNRAFAGVSRSARLREGARLATVAALHQHGIADNAYRIGHDVLLGRPTPERTCHAVEARAVPGALDRSVRQHFTSRQWHCLMRALVVQRRDPVTTADQADALARFEGNGERPVVRDRIERNGGQSSIVNRQSSIVNR